MVRLIGKDLDDRDDGKISGLPLPRPSDPKLIGRRSKPERRHMWAHRREAKLWSFFWGVGPERHRPLVESVGPVLAI